LYSGVTNNTADAARIVWRSAFHSAGSVEILIIERQIAYANDRKAETLRRDFYQGICEVVAVAVLAKAADEDGDSMGSSHGFESSVLGLRTSTEGNRVGFPLKRLIVRDAHFCLHWPSSAEL
jgi:hypothetical protein